MEFTTAGVTSLNSLSREEFKTISKFFLQAVVTGSSDTPIDEHLEKPLCALSTFVLEAGKIRCTIDTMRDSLNEQGVNNEIQTLMMEIYEKHKDKIIAHMSATGIAVPGIVGLDWRLDYAVRSKTAGRSNEPLFFVTLTVKDRGLLRNIEMVATSEQLQDLLSKVKDAVKQTERLLTAAT